MARLGWQLSGVALVVALALLGHDSAMAGDAHDWQATSPASTAPGVSSHAANETAIGSGHHEGAPDASSECGALQPALPNASDSGLAILPANAITAPIHGLTTSIERVWLEPTWPPGTRRALVQVYRI